MIGQIRKGNDMGRSAFTVFLLLFALCAGAQDRGFDYTFIQGSYQQIEYDDFDDDGDGLGLALSFAISDHFHLFGGYSGLDIDSDIDTSAWNFGVGVNGSLTDLMDVIVRLSYETREVDLPAGGTFDNDGYGLVRVAFASARTNGSRSMAGSPTSIATAVARPAWMPAFC